MAHLANALAGEALPSFLWLSPPPLAEATGEPTRHVPCGKGAHQPRSTHPLPGVDNWSPLYVGHQCPFLIFTDATPSAKQQALNLHPTGFPLLPVTIPHSHTHPSCQHHMHTAHPCSPTHSPQLHQQSPSRLPIHPSLQLAGYCNSLTGDLLTDAALHQLLQQVAFTSSDLSRTGLPPIAASGNSPSAGL